MGVLSRKQNNNDNSDQVSQFNVKKPAAPRKPKIGKAKTSGKIMKEY